MAQKTWEKMTLKEKMEVMRAETAALAQKLGDIERRLDEGKKVSSQDASRLSQTLSEFNVRLSSVAANVLAVSAVAERAADMANKPEKKSSLWDNHEIEIKK